MAALSSFISGHRPSKATSYTRKKQNLPHSYAVAESIMPSANIPRYFADRSFKTEVSSNIQGYLVAGKAITVIFLVYNHLEATNLTW